MMKSVYFAAAAAMMVSSVATADTVDGAFLSANVGHGNSSSRGDGNAYGVLGGYRWASTSSLSLGIEGGLMDLGRQDHEVHNRPLLNGPHVYYSTTRFRTTQKALLLGVNVRWEFAEQYFVTAHGGVARYRQGIRTKDFFAVDNAPADVYTHRYRLYDTNYYAGAGFGFNFSPQVSLALTYDHYVARYRLYSFTDKVDTNVWGASVEYRF